MRRFRRRTRQEGISAVIRTQAPSTFGIDRKAAAEIQESENHGKDNINYIYGIYKKIKGDKPQNYVVKRLTTSVSPSGESAVSTFTTSLPFWKVRCTDFTSDT